MILNQPSEGRLGVALVDAIQQTGATGFDAVRILSAYVKRSGVSLLYQPLKDFRQRGGSVRAAVGIDSGNTSKEGLALLLECADEVYVFHDKNPARTFHPKMYLLEKGGLRAVGYVGSSNLTHGGLLSNFELNVRLEFDLTVDQSRRQFDELTETFRWYSTRPSPCCLRLDTHLLDDLEARHLLGPERSLSPSRGSPLRSGPTVGPSPFGTELFPPLMIPLPRLPPALTSASAPVSAAVSGPTPAFQHGQGGLPVTLPASGFWKRLSANDVSTSSSPGQIVIPIEFAPLFPPTLQELETRPSGARQGEAFLNLVFVDPSGSASEIEGARAILYVPAPTHPRQNREIRFTFRQRNVLLSLRVGDILEFRRSDSDDPWFEVRHLQQGSSQHTSAGAPGLKFGPIR
jgi:HKD family nuclease